MLNGLVIGMLWGAIVGEYFGVSADVFNTIRYSIIFLALFALFCHWLIPCKSKILSFFRMFFCCILGVLWTGIHSPPPLRVVEKELEVLWSQGCGDTEDDLIVRDFYKIYYARGSSLQGDHVILRPDHFQSFRPSVVATGVVENSGYWCLVSQAMRNAIFSRMRRFPDDVGQWLMGFVLGRKGAIEPNLEKAFRNVGLLHVLVLSGGHLSVIASLSLFIFRLGILIPYTMRMVTVRSMITFWSLSSISSVFLLFFFCLAVGFSPSVQRAFLAVFVMNILPMFGLAHRIKTRIRLIFILQGMIFPINILSLSMILSWCGSLLLIAFFESLYLKSTVAIAFQALQIQLMFFATSLLFFGSAGILSPLANLVGLILFGFLLPFDLLASMLSFKWLDAIAVIINRLVIDGVFWLDYYQSQLPLPYVSIPKEMTMNFPAGRLVIVTLISIFYALAGIRQLPAKGSSIRKLKS